MTTQLAFAFGMLTVVSIAMVIGIVVSLVKAFKLKSEVSNLTSHLEQVIQNIDRRIDDVINNNGRIIDEVTSNIDRRIDDVIRELSQTIDQNDINAHQRNDDIIRELNHKIDQNDMNVHQRIDDTHRIIDSRFDKVQNKIVSAAVDLINLQNSKSKSEPAKVDVGSMETAAIDLVIEKTKQEKQLLKS